MTPVDAFIGKLGLKYEDLTQAERDVYLLWNKTLDSNQLTVELVRDYVRSIRDALEQELAVYKQETPHSWIGVLSLFIPFYGLIQKWYQDQNRIGIQSRLRNIVLLEAFLIGPVKARKAVEQAMTSMLNNRMKG